MEGSSEIIDTPSIFLMQKTVQNILPKNKYYVALGSVVDAGLSRVLDDILALPDIPEVESHRLSELCKILNALEGLFVEDTQQVRAMSKSSILQKHLLTISVAFICCRICPLLAQIFIPLRAIGQSVCRILLAALLNHSPFYRKHLWRIYHTYFKKARWLILTLTNLSSSSAHYSRISLYGLRLSIS
jgi:hypothetical protein